MGLMLLTLLISSTRCLSTKCSPEERVKMNFVQITEIILIYKCRPCAAWILQEEVLSFWQISMVGFFSHTTVFYSKSDSCFNFAVSIVFI